MKKQETYKKINEYNKEHYERIGVSYPKGTKERILATGDTLNNFVKSAVFAELDRIEGERR